MAEAIICRDTISVVDISGPTAPTSKTKGIVGQKYTNTTTGEVYICTFVTNNNTYTWEYSKTIPIISIGIEDYKALPEEQKNAEVIYAITDDYEGTPVDTVPTEGSTNVVTSGGVFTALAGKAPAGYGLGGSIGSVGADIPINESGKRDFNKATNTGWYYIYGIASGHVYENGPDCSAAGFDYLSFSFMRVERYRFAVQTVYLCYSSGVYVLQRYSGQNDYENWLPWEWVNPPMHLGVEYRTTKRYDSRVVYEKIDENGIVHWRTEGETEWKTYAETGGIVPINMGGTGGSSIITARSNLGITVLIRVPVSGSTTITLPAESTILISIGDNRRKGCVLVQTSSGKTVQVANNLIEPYCWSYSYSGTSFTINNADTDYYMDVCVTTLGHNKNNGPYLGG